MKKIYIMLMVLATAAITFSSCSSDEDPFFTASENDFPRILNTDIPEWVKGEPGTLMSIERTTNFSFEVVTTPVDYTSVTWYMDDEKVFEGKIIDMPMLAGEYIVKIVATTTKGLETSRTTKLIVRPIEGDPVPANKQRERLVKPGTHVTLHGENMDNITTIIMGGRELACTYNAKEGCLEYSIPADLAEGTYRIKLVDNNNEVYGGGQITVSLNPEYKVEETVLWEGHHYVSWDKADGDPNKTFSALQNQFADLPVGAILTVTYTIDESATYHQMQLMSAWWTLLPNHEKLEFTEDGTYEYTINEDAIKLCNAQNGFLIGGHGFFVDKVTVKQ